MAVTFDLTPQLERRLNRDLSDLGRTAKEAFLVRLYQEGRLSRPELAEALGLDRFQTDALLKSLHVYEGSYSLDDADADRRTLSRLLEPAQRKAP